MVGLNTNPQNNYMKKIVAAAIVLLIAGTSVSAQTKEKDHKQKMAQELGLTAEQKAEMKRIHEAEKNELEALKNDKTLSKEQAIAARKAIHEKYRTQFKNVLTDEQQKKAASLKGHKEHHEMGKDSGHHKAAAPKNARAVHREGARKDMGQKPSQDKMEAELNLTAEQKNKIAASREAFKTQAESIKKDESLTREQKQASMRSLSEKQREEFRSILTAEQKQRLDSNRKAHTKNRK